MGKHKTQRRSGQSDPLKRSEAKTRQLREERILPLLAKLRSSRLADRAMAIGAINALVDLPNMRHMLLKENLLSVVLSTTLTDDSQEIVSEGYGLLRNLVLEDGREIALALFENNIITSIKHVLGKLHNAWFQTSRRLPAEHRRTFLEFIENIFGLISALCLADDDIHETVGAQLSVPCVKFALPVSKSGTVSAAETSLEVIYVLSEGRTDVLQLLSAETQTVAEAGLKSESCTVYYYGILANLRASDDDPANIMTGIIDVLASIDFSSLKMPDVEENSTPEELKKAALESVAARARTNAVQVGFEILATLIESLATNPFEDALKICDERVVPLCLKGLPVESLVFRAATVANNVGWAFNALDLQWEASAEKLWHALQPLVSGNDIYVLTPTIGALAAVAKFFAGEVPLSESFITDLFKFGHPIPAEFESCRIAYEELLRNVLVLLAVLGSQPSRPELTTHVSKLIVLIVENYKNVQPQLLVDAIDAMFDVFGKNDSAYNSSLFIDSGFQEELAALAPSIERYLICAGQEGASVAYERAEEVAENLQRFIEYKASGEP